MRLLTFILDGRPRLGALVDDEVVDLNAAQSTFSGKPLPPLEMRQLIETGPEVWEQLAHDLAIKDVTSFVRPLADLELTAPILNPSKVIGIGLNYFDHISEHGGMPPERPVVFAKFPSALIGPNQEICWDPDLASSIDWEGELAVVIGRRAYRVTADDAYDCVFGYTIGNDVTARDWQNSDGQWVRSKSLDTFCPLGPWIVTRDEMSDPHGRSIRCRVNDETVQDSNTGEMIFRVPYLIEFLSQSLTLLPGDVILTGTPGGVGHYQQPPRYLQNGDVVAVEIAGLGTLTNRCRMERRNEGQS